MAPSLSSSHSATVTKASRAAFLYSGVSVLTLLAGINPPFAARLEYVRPHTKSHGASE